MFVLLLHCSINDTLIIRIPQRQNVLTKLINILHSTFVPISIHMVRNLFWILCAKIDYYYHFGYMLMQHLPLRVSQGAVAAFYKCVGQSHNCLYQFLGCCIPKNY